MAAHKGSITARWRGRAERLIPANTVCRAGADGPQLAQILQAHLGRGRWETLRVKPSSGFENPRSRVGHHPLRGLSSMSWLALIPVVSLLLSAAFAAVAVAWNSERRATGPMIQIFVCIGGWALMDLLSQLEADPGRVIYWFGWMHVPVLLLGTCVLRLVAGESSGRAAAGARSLVRCGFGFSAGVAVLSPWLPGVVETVHRGTLGGWVPEYGPVSMAVVAVGCVFPAAAIRIGFRERTPSESARSEGPSYAVIAGIVLSVSVTLMTDILLPFVGLSFPRLGALSAALAAIAVWLHRLHQNDDLALTPQGTARAVLADLHEGVAFVSGDGVILSANDRLAELAQRRASDLVGASLTDLVEAPIDLVRGGLRDREFRMRCGRGEQAAEPVPVSISSSLVREDGGRIGWIIVVFRDLRGVDALRRRLLTSGRLAAIGELAAGIAHEVNNPAAFIRSDLNFLRARLAEIHEGLAKHPASAETSIFRDGPDRIARAIDGIERIVEVVSDVKGFAHLGGAEGSNLHPGAIVESAVRLARLERREEVALHVARFGGLRSVSSGQDLKQVLLAMIRLMTISSRVGGSVEIALEEAADGLHLSLCADDLVQRAESQVHRFEMAREDVLEASAADLALAIAIELIDQLGGSLSVDARSEFALSIDLVWPLAAEGTD